MPGFPDLERPLADGVVTLRLTAERDIPEVLLAYQDDRELHLRLGARRPPTGAELGRRAERAEAERAAGVGVTLTVLEPDSDVCAGEVRVHHVDWENARADLGIWIAPQLRGRGMARSALRLVGGWLLGELGFERVQLLTEVENERVRRAAEAAGFTYEGILHEYLVERGSRQDVAVLSLVRRDLAG